MSMVTGRLRWMLGRRPEAAAAPRPDERQRLADVPPIDFAPNGPALAYFQAASGLVTIDEVERDRRDAGGHIPSAYAISHPAHEGGRQVVLCA